MKKYIWLLAVVCFIGFAACDTETDAEKTLTTITSFKLKNGYNSKNDTIYKLQNYKFIIDTTTMTIYNEDSLPYQCRLDSLVPVFSGTASYYYLNDTIKYDLNAKGFKFDTLDLNQPLTITAYAEKKGVSRTYTLDLRVHQIDPELYVWEGLNSEIYTENATNEVLKSFDQSLWLFVDNGSSVSAMESADGKSWTKMAVSGFPQGVDIRTMVNWNETLCLYHNDKLYTSTDATTWSVKANGNGAITKLLFAMNGVLYAQAIANGTSTLYSTIDGSTWNNVATLPTMFPVSGAGVWTDTTTSGAMRTYVVGGRAADGTLLNSVWCTENGEYWANMISGDWFSPREGVAVIQYDNVLMMFGGRDDNGLVSPMQLVSPDFGVTWRLPLDDENISTLCTPRYNANVAQGEHFYLYLISGRNDSRFIKDSWRGRRNHLLFNKNRSKRRF
ncbi:MAG: DUF6242 domain-containing protein [Paludibacteraceae bacterium]|nr:DUF6242 domain-containing protein [Paludibacteraceae bacterium]